jgi:hypothetical protein
MNLKQKYDHVICWASHIPTKHFPPSVTVHEAVRCFAELALLDHPGRDSIAVTARLYGASTSWEFVVKRFRVLDIEKV